MYIVSQWAAPVKSWIERAHLQQLLEGENITDSHPPTTPCHPLGGFELTMFNWQHEKLNILSAVKLVLVICKNSTER